MIVSYNIMISETPRLNYYTEKTQSRKGVYEDNLFVFLFLLNGLRVKKHSH